MITLAEHVRKLFEERESFLADAPADFPEFHRATFEAARPVRLEQAAAVDVEINEAIVLMRRLGLLPGRGEQSAGVLSEGEAAQS